MAVDNLELGNLEYLILNYSIRDRSFWLRVYEHIEKKYFAKDANRQIYGFFHKYFKKYNELPDYQITLNEIGEGVDNEIIESVFEPLSEEEHQKYKDYIYTNTTEFIQENMARTALMNSVDWLEKKEFDKMNEAIKQVLKFTLDTSLGINLLNLDERYERLKEMMHERVPTGFPQFDAILHGGWARKELYAVAAPPGIGKSIFLANWSVNAIKQGFNTLVYTLEISEERLSMRHDAILTKIPTDELMFDMDRLRKKYNVFSKTSKANLWIKEFPTKSASVNHLKAHYEQLVLYENFEPDVIFIDYAGLMRPSHRMNDSYEELKTIYEDLRGWAGELDKPIITAAQTNRKSLDEKGGTKEVITQAQVSESLGITQTLDVFMTINQSRNEKEEGIIKLWMDKHRHGESSKQLTYNIDYRNFLLEELDI